MSNDAVNFDLLVKSGGETISFKQGETIFKEGDPAVELYVIKSRRVEIRRGNHLLDTLDGDNIFGEMALIDSAPRSASAVASTDVILAPVSERQFLFLVSQTPFFALTVMRVLVRRLRAANSAI
jgi:CRP/FNR family transcriptional regulator, cyclic AMP receptor protein